jgi:hypothetical protein
MLRCHRLRKTCFPQTPAPPRRRARKHKQAIKKTSRVEALEGRIEELSSRLAAVDGNHTTAGSSSSVVSESAPIPNATIETRRESIAGHGDWLESGQLSSPLLESINSTSRVPIEPLLLNSAEILRQTQQSVMKAQTRKTDSESDPTSTPGGDEEIIAHLLRYRTHMQYRFPFVIVPPELASTEERQRRPFLWRAVKMAALWQENARRVQLGRKLLKDLTDAILLSTRRSFDVVQGLLVFIAWYALDFPA